MIAFTLGIPNKGRLREPALNLLKKAGFILEEENPRVLTSKVNGENILMTFLGAKDIPVYISEGFLNFGITGYDLICETGVKVEELLDLKFGYCKLVFALPENKGIKQQMRVATQFPNLASAFFSKKGIFAGLIAVSGAIESTIQLGIADAIVDLTSTGTTLKMNNLTPVETILESTARLIANKKFFKRNKEIVDSFVARLEAAYDKNF